MNKEDFVILPPTVEALFPDSLAINFSPESESLEEEEALVKQLEERKMFIREIPEQFYSGF